MIRRRARWLIVVALGASLSAGCGSQGVTPRPVATTPAASGQAASTPSPSRSSIPASPGGSGQAGVSPAASQSAEAAAPPTPAATATETLLDRLRVALDKGAGGAVLDLVPEVDAGGLQLDGSADDGGGPGRLLAVVSATGSMAAGNLCLDAEFRQGAQCVRVVLPGGLILYRRGLVVAGRTRSITVAIRRPDGSGVLLESDNFRVEAPPVIVGNRPRPTPTITRADPVFTLDELVGLAIAVEAATRDCSLTACP
jgi:hypothetical protein